METTQKEGRLNSASARTGLERLATNASAFGVGGAQGDDVGWKLTGRGTSNALVCTGGEKGVTVVKARRLPASGSEPTPTALEVFNPSPLFFFTGAGQETDGTGRETPAFAGGTNGVALNFSDWVFIDLRSAGQ